MNRYLLPEPFVKHPFFLALKPRDRAKCQGIVNWIVKYNRKSKARGYVSLPREKLREIAGGSYKKYINLLKENGIIEENSKYSYKSESSRFQKPFTKSYRLLRPYAEGALNMYSDMFPPKKRAYVDQSTVDDSICQTIKVNYRGLEVEFPLWLTEEEKYDAFYLSEKLLCGAANARKGKKVERYFHSLLSASREIRALVVRDGIPLHDYDMRAAFAGDLLGAILKPHVSPEELAGFIKTISEEDIYSGIGRISSFKAHVKGKWQLFEGRECGKIAMRKFTFSKKHDVLKSGRSRNPAANYFKIYFPEIYRFIVAQNGSEFSRQLQNLEASLFCTFLVPKAQTLGVWMLPMHDGWLCASAEAGETLRYVFEGEFERRYGFKPHIVCKGAATAKDTSIIASETLLN